MLHIPYQFPLSSQPIWRLCSVPWLPPPLTWEALGSRNELCWGWAVGMAAGKGLRRDEKHRSRSGDSGPPSSCLGLEQVTVLGNGALFQCQIHGALAFPEHRRCKAAPRARHHSSLHVTAQPPGTPPQDGPARAAVTALQSSQEQDSP